MIDENKRISRFGVGPLFAALSAIYGAATVYLTLRYDPLFAVALLPYATMMWAGISLAAAGLVFFVLSVIAVTRAYNSDTLVTGGVYRLCRHPLYAAWAVGIVPGIALLVNSWLCLTVPLFMYAVLRALVRKEETYLMEKFGYEYMLYKQRVPAIMPLGWLKRSARS